MSEDAYARFASQLADAMDAVNSCRYVRDEENIEQFRDLDLIWAELRSMHGRASTMRFADAEEREK